MIIDASGLVAGRLASKVAKAARNGETIVVLNAENSVLVGKKSAVMKKFQQRVDAAVKSNPHYGPKYDRIPNKMLRKMIKGMLPNKSRTAERLIKRIEVFNTIPEKYEGKDMETIEEIKFNEKNEHMTMKKVAELLGGKW